MFYTGKGGEKEEEGPNGEPTEVNRLTGYYVSIQMLSTSTGAKGLLAQTALDYIQSIIGVRRKPLAPGGPARCGA